MKTLSMKIFIFFNLVVGASAALFVTHEAQGTTLEKTSGISWEEDLALLNDRISGLKAVQPPPCYVDQKEIPKLRAVKPRTEEELKLLELIVTKTIKATKAKREAQESMLLDFMITKTSTESREQNVAKKEIAEAQIVEAKPRTRKNIAVENVPKRRKLLRSLSLSALNLFSLEKKSAKIQSVVKVSPGYSYVVAPTFPSTSKRGRLASFFRL